MAAISAFRSQSFCLSFSSHKKGFPLKSGCGFGVKTKDSTKTRFCHSVGNLTKWFDEVNLSSLDFYGMTKMLLKMIRKICQICESSNY